MTSAVRGVAAATPDKKAQDDLIEAARAVIQEAGNLIKEAKKAIANPGDPENQGRLAQVCGKFLPKQNDPCRKGKGVTLN